MLIQGANGPIFALIALDSGNIGSTNALWTEKLIDGSYSTRREDRIFSGKQQ